MFFFFVFFEALRHHTKSKNSLTSMPNYDSVHLKLYGKKKMSNVISSYHDVLCVCLKKKVQKKKSACVEKVFDFKNTSVTKC